jgi:hypothetical protein
MPPPEYAPLLPCPNDFRAALLISRETGFRTWGSVSMLTEIPPGSHSGSHKR